MSNLHSANKQTALNEQRSKNELEVQLHMTIFALKHKLVFWRALTIACAICFIFSVIVGRLS